MINFLKNNYYRQVGTGATFSVEFGKMPIETLNHTEESKKAAIELYDLKQGELHLCYSGGVDSEFMLSIFMDLKISFTPVLFRFTPDYNIHDLAYSLKFCQAHNLTPKIIDIDFDHFVTSGRLLDICKAIRTSAWTRAGVCEGISKLDGTVILGDCEPYFCLNKETMQWEFRVDEHEFAWGNFYKQQGIYGTPWFGAYTPEKFMSFINHQQIKDLINHKIPGKLGSNTSRVIVYNSNNNFALEPRAKFNGYENFLFSKLETSEMFKDIEKELNCNNGKYLKEAHSFIKMITHV